MEEDTTHTWKPPILWPPKTWRVNRWQQLCSEFIIGIAALGLLFAALVAIIAIFAIPYQASLSIIAGSHESLRNYLLSLGAILGVPFLIWRTFIASHQAETGREALYTQLFSKGVEGLGSEKIIKIIDKTPRLVTKDGNFLTDAAGKSIIQTDQNLNPIYDTKTIERTEINIEVRLGSIYALERTALDSNRDRIPIMRTIAAYIRNSINKDKIDANSDVDNRPDIKAAFEILGRFPIRSKIDVSYDLSRIDMKNIKLRKCSLESCDFTGSISNDILILRSSLVESILHEIKWENARILHSDLDYTNFYKASMDNIFITESSIKNINASQWNINSGKLFNSTIYNSKLNEIEAEGCIFRGMKLSDTEFLHSNISNSRIWETSIRNCSFFNCDLSFSDFRGTEAINLSFEGCNLTQTILPENCTFDPDRNFAMDENWIKEQQKSQPFLELVKSKAQLNWREWLSTRQNASRSA